MTMQKLCVATRPQGGKAVDVTKEDRYFEGTQGYKERLRTSTRNALERQREVQAERGKSPDSSLDGQWTRAQRFFNALPDVMPASVGHVLSPTPKVFFGSILLFVNR